MTAQHTPGPWYIRTNRHTSTDGRPWGWLDAAPPGGPQHNIPGVQVTWTRGESSEANARLIAAAPDLLKALQAIVQSWDSNTFDRELFVKSELGDYWTPAAEMVNSETIAAARAAIARATHKEQL